jgi:hypothetical protein
MLVLVAGRGKTAAGCGTDNQDGGKCGQYQLVPRHLGSFQCAISLGITDEKVGRTSPITQLNIGKLDETFVI